MTTRENKLQKFEAAYGRYIIMWNQADNAMRSLLLTMSGVSATTRILTAELGSRGLEDAINALAEVQPDDIKKAINYLVTVFSNLREYRNYHAHGVHSYYEDHDGNWFGLITTMSAKGKLAYSEDFLSVETLTALHNHAENIRDGAIAIMDFIDPQEGSQVDPPLPSPETLRQPVGRLQKNLSYPLREQRRRPASSA